MACAASVHRRERLLRASYDYGVGAAGNVGAGAINSSPSLPAGLKVTNPVRTWNGTEAETVSEGEKQITRYLQHRDRLVSATDFETITLRTPGVGHRTRRSDSRLSILS